MNYWEIAVVLAAMAGAGIGCFVAWLLLRGSRRVRIDYRVNGHSVEPTADQLRRLQQVDYHITAAFKNMQAAMDQFWRMKG
jgi:hypothetical protein